MSRLGVGFIGSGFNTRFHIQSWQQVRDGIDQLTSRAVSCARKAVSGTVALLGPVAAG